MVQSKKQKSPMVILVQLGSPASPGLKDVRKFLKEFLGDPRVVDINPFLWKIILNLFVLPFRPAKSARLYRRIWNEEKQEFPLIRYTEDFAQKVGEQLKDQGILVRHAYLLAEPRFAAIWDEYEKDPGAVSEFIIVPLFPQFSESTTMSVIDIWNKELHQRAISPSYRFLNCFHTSKAFIDNSVLRINASLAQLTKEKGKLDALVISFHGIPKRRVLYKGDFYFDHCFETFQLLKERIEGIDSDRIHMTFQSRFGSEEWLTPYTENYCQNLVAEGHSKMAVYCPAFVADCLETIDEIGTELKEDIESLGGEVYPIPCLNDDDRWAQDFATFLQAEVNGTNLEREQLAYEFRPDQYDKKPEIVMQSPPLSAPAKKSLKLIFLTLFLDLVGFSIIFPLFPELAKHYLEVDADNYWLRMIFDGIGNWASVTGGDLTGIVLFGGALGALYSFLQFLAAPIWGGLSDRIGRRPILLMSVGCLALSYLLWFFSGSFTLLILARFIGGIMGGNISAATAVVADVTTKENRSKGMAFVGIAFAMGFIFGPALGGIFSMIDLTKLYPSLVSYGVNPFSMPALVAFILSVVNFINLYRSFDETLPAEKRGLHKSDRSVNPIVLFKPLPYAGVNLTNFGHFLFLMAFSGMEFTLTFLAFERLGYRAMDNAYMFIFIGLIIALVQGGHVRRKAHQVGEKKMVLQGLACIIPGLILIAYAQVTWVLYAGLFFLAVGSAMAIPCLTSLVSLYTPSQYQGRSVGIFRSLGALARVLGPVLASIIYWKYGSQYPYLIGSFFLFLPILMLSRLPKPALK